MFGAKGLARSWIYDKLGLGGSFAATILVLKEWRTVLELRSKDPTVEASSYGRLIWNIFLSTENSGLKWIQVQCPMDPCTMPTGMMK